MRRFLFTGYLLAALLSAGDVRAVGSRIKDLTMIAGARENQLVGYGLVTGLAGDGDKNPVYTIQSIANMLQRFGYTIWLAESGANALKKHVLRHLPFLELDFRCLRLGKCESLAKFVPIAQF